jgi:hypothetical protein
MKTTFLLFLLITTTLSAQDIITLKNGEEIKAKVTAVNPNDIQYRKFNDKDGPLYTKYKSEVFMIKYANGSKDVFSNTSGGTSTNASIDPSTQRELKSGTQFTVELAWDLNSKYVQAGQTVEFKVVGDVTIDNKTVIAGGTSLQGIVVNSEKAKGLGQEGKLDIQLNNVKAVDGQTVQLSGYLSKDGDNKTTETVVIGALLFWPVLFAKGKEAVIPAGSRFNATVSQTVVVKVN